MSWDWIGATMLAICGLPAAIHAHRIGKADDISWLFLILWLLGELLLLIDRMPKQDWALIINYFANIVFIDIILRYKVCPSPSHIKQNNKQENK